jgi:hypothetical protein
MNVTQVVQVKIGGAIRQYTYAWVFDPTDGGRPLKVGDRVELPPSQVQEDGSSGVVSSLSSPYTGEMKSIVRVIDGPKAGAPEDDLWGGWETGGY